MRRRIASLTDSSARDVSEYAEQELGIATPWSTNLGWKTILERWALQDVLDLITVVARYLANADRQQRFNSNRAREWIDGVSRIFAEENVHYAVDARGGVHFSFDAEFSHNQSATIAALNEQRYRNTSDLFETAMADLSSAPPNGKGAIRHVFYAIEGLFKLMFPSEPRLTNKGLDVLKPLLQKHYAADKTALQASMKMLESFKDWVDSAHFYRHEQGDEEVAQPPLSVAVHLTSVGAANLRWLAEIDAKLIADQSAKEA
jgi:hypothetical protein